MEVMGGGGSGRLFAVGTRGVSAFSVFLTVSYSMFSVIRAMLSFFSLFFLRNFAFH